MGRHRNYTEEERMTAIQALIANDGALSRTSFELGIPTSTLDRWWRAWRFAQPRLPAPPPPPMPAPVGPWAPGEPAATGPLARLRDQLLDNALALAHTLACDGDSLEPSEQARLLSQIVGALIKLSALTGSDGEEKVTRIEYADPDGTLHETPPWARGGAEVESPLQGAGLWPALGEDGSGEAGDS